AACFLQIPRHRGHPCIKLTTTTAFMVRDFHPIDCTHAGRTKKDGAFAPSLSVLWHINRRIVLVYDYQMNFSTLFKGSFIILIPWLKAPKVY
ncbi:hypothetical protein NGI46_29155, partial [Peribacillus butanolivorans]|uniref:hypothetical protein n=1 Tax=Peribacillus butanolivorans TaxID=421767 RepID=UPI00207C90DB